MATPIQSPKRTQPIVANAPPLILPVPPVHPSMEKTTLPIVNNQIITTPNSPKPYSVDNPTAGLICCPPTSSDYIYSPNPGVIEFVYGEYTVNENAPGSASIYVRRINGSDGISYVNYTSSNGTAINPTNYTGSSGTLMWADGEEGTQKFNIKINNISGWNPNLGFTASLNNVINSLLGLDEAHITILNIDPYNPGVISFVPEDPIQSPILETGGQITFTASRFYGSDGVTSAVWQTRDDEGTAVDGVNFVGNYGTLLWAHCDMSDKYMTVNILHDFVYTPTLYFITRITDVVNSTVAVDATTTEILNVDQFLPGTMSFVSPTYSVTEPSEASSHTSSVTFYISRSGGHDGTISCSCATSNGSALAGIDYKETSSKYRWIENDVTLKPFTVEIYRNPNVNYNIGFTASLSNPYSGSIGTVSKSIATIINDGNPGTIRFQNSYYEILEPDGAPNLTGSLYFTVQRVGGSDGIASASMVTSNGSATSPVDYKATSSNFVWTHGDLAWRTYSIEVYRNTLKNTDIGFTCSLNNFFNATAGTITQSIGAILNTLNPSTIYIVDPSYSVDEPSIAPYTSSLSFIVKRTGGSGISSASIATSNGSATSPVDYKATSSKFVWAGGDLVDKSFDVEVYKNPLKQINIGFTASLSDPYNATLANYSKSIGNIIDVTNAGVIEFVDASYTVYENGGSMTFHITRSGGSDGAVTASFTTIDGTAISGSANPYDYIGKSFPLMWENGEGTSKYVAILINGEDNIIDGDKYFSGSLFNPIGGAVLGLSQSTVTIIDSTVYVQFLDDRFVAAENGNPEVILALEKVGNTPNTVSVVLHFIGGSTDFQYPPASGFTSGPGDMYFVYEPMSPHAVNMYKTITWEPTSPRVQFVPSYFNGYIDDTLRINSTCSIESPVNCVAGARNKAVTRVAQVNGSSDVFYNIARFEKSASYEITEFVNNTASLNATVLNHYGIEVNTTASYTTVDNTAIAGVDYKAASGEVKFEGVPQPGPLLNSFASLPIDVEVYSSIRGKSFFLQLSNPQPAASVSLVYPTKCEMYGRIYGSYVTFLTSSMTLPATDGFTEEPYIIEVDRKVADANPLTVIANMTGIYNTENFFFPDGNTTHVLTWGSGETGLKILTFGGAVVQSMLENGYFTMSLAKQYPTDDVEFSPTSSIRVTYAIP
jgi:hypothetical protein